MSKLTEIVEIFDKNEELLNDIIKKQECIIECLQKQLAIKDDHIDYLENTLKEALLTIEIMKKRMGSN